MELNEQLKKNHEMLTNKYSIYKLFLFGSYARGIAMTGSDIDLCIILNLAGRRKIDLIKEIRREISKNIEYPLDIILYDSQEFDKRASFKNTMEYNIKRDVLLING